MQEDYGVQEVGKKREERIKRGEDGDVIEAALVLLLINKEDKLSEHMQTKTYNTVKNKRREVKACGRKSMPVA